MAESTHRHTLLVDSTHLGLLWEASFWCVFDWLRPTRNMILLTMITPNVFRIEGAHIYEQFKWKQKMSRNVPEIKRTIQWSYAYGWLFDQTFTHDSARFSTICCQLKNIQHYYGRWEYCERPHSRQIVIYHHGESQKSIEFHRKVKWSASTPSRSYKMFENWIQLTAVFR